MQFEGGCRCGNVRYSADAEPIFVGVCHCSDCQKSSGSAFNVVIAVPKPTVSVQGTLSTFESHGDSGKATYRRFCPVCASPIVGEAEGMPNVIMIPVGTLDDKSWVKPQMEIFCDSAQPWVKLEGDQQRFPKMPARP